MEYWTREMEKQVGARVQIVLQDPQLLKVYQHFGGKLFRRSSVFHGLGDFLTDKQVRGRRCLEIGTWNGLTASVLSRFFDEVVTVDIAHNALKHEVLAHLGITNVRCIDLADNLEKIKVIKAERFDFAYLDGDHANDTELDFKLVKRCGRVLFHEAWDFQPPVWDLVNRLPAREVSFGGSGLALWERRDDGN